MDTTTVEMIRIVLPENCPRQFYHRAFLNSTTSEPILTVSLKNSFRQFYTNNDSSTKELTMTTLHKNWPCQVYTRPENDSSTQELNMTVLYKNWPWQFYHITVWHNSILYTILYACNIFEQVTIEKVCTLFHWK